MSETETAKNQTKMVEMAQIETSNLGYYSVSLATIYIWLYALMKMGFRIFHPLFKC